jgi:type I restriction enzyme S subunit
MFIELTRTMIEKFAPATAQKNINLEILNELMLPLPPLAEQTEIVARVEALMERCRDLEAEIARSRAHAEALLQAVLREAFAPAAA